jgi:D-alanyl-lipoteichoic acid acyltransferase DltB (MBOAT superfamily)
MLFNSAEFLFFFVCVTAAFFVLPQRTRWMLLLAASIYFYMQFRPVYVLILFFTILIDYFAGIWIERARARHKRIALVTSLVANISVLAFFKYFDFLSINLFSIWNGMGFAGAAPLLDILLPIGLSFHTFQSMSYTIEVYRGNQKAEKNLGVFAVYVMFYPQLVAGPIERPQNLLPQFRSPHFFNAERVVDGLRLMCWGLFKKVVIADRLALVVDNVYNAPREYNGIILVIATIFFAYQIYCDFSGYSDMAVGAARVMGFELMENFRFPYAARSFSDFWSRWHVSLSSWFRDYVYIPLGGNRVSALKWARNIAITLFLSGLWHGANWTFICWGLIHAGYLIAERGLGKMFTKKFPVGGPPVAAAILKSALVLSMVGLAWIFFRAHTVSDATYILTHSFLGWDGPSLRASLSLMLGGALGLFAKGWLCAFGCIGFLELVQYLQRRSGRPFGEAVQTYPTWARWSFYYVLVGGIICLGAFNESRFIYFQF